LTILCGFDQKILKNDKPRTVLAGIENAACQFMNIRLHVSLVEKMKLPISSFPLVLAIVFCGFSHAAEVKIEQAADKSVKVEAKTYSAAFDAGGRWKSLVIAGKEMFGEGAPFPSDSPATSINVRDQLLAIRNEKTTVEYSFDPTGINIETNGGALNIFLSPDITAFVQDKVGVRSAAETKSLGDVRKLIAGPAAFEVDRSFHVVKGKMFPSLLTRGGKGEDPFKTRMECGVSASGTEMVEMVEFSPLGKTTNTVPSYSPGETPGYVISLRNLGPSEVSPAIAFTVGNAFVGGTTSPETVLPAQPLKPGETAKTEVKIPMTAPGIHWVNFELRDGSEVIKRERRAFVFDPDNFRPELTRPADFEMFWKTRLDAMRKIPLNPKVTEVPERSSTTAGQYKVEITDPKGNPVMLDLQAPRKPGKYLAMFGGKMLEKAEDPNRILLVFNHKQWPEEATFNRWVAADDNNLFDCYLLAVRITDYLRSRNDVEWIFLIGGSRTGPIQLANAALDPTKICAVDAHVPTSMGISSREHPYRGWGKVPNPVAMADYVDPVNFAPDITVPVMLDEGVYDGLSPAPGAIAFYNAATKAPWKRISIEPGGHGYFTSGFRPAAQKELNELLKIKADGSVDDKVMKEH